MNVLVDSSADDNFVDSELVEDVQIHLETLDPPRQDNF